MSKRDIQAEALEAAAKWFDTDDEEGGPGYHAPDRSPYYETRDWVVSWLRFRADQIRAEGDQ